MILQSRRILQDSLNSFDSDIDQDVQSLNDQPRDHKRFLIVLVCSMVLVILLIVNLLNRYFIYGTLSAPAIMAMIAVSLVPLFSPFKKRVKYAGIYLAFVGATMLPAAAFHEGGLLSVPIFWFPAIPLIAMFFCGIRPGLFFALLGVIEILGFWYVHEQHRNVLATNFTTDPLAFRYAAVAAIAVTLFSACLAALSRWYETVAYRKVLESENQFRLLASGIPVMVWRINRNRKLDFANRNLKRFLGRRDFDHLKSVIRDEDYRHVMSVFLDAWKRRAAFKVEFCCRDAADRTRWVSCTGVPRKMTNQEGFLGYVGVCIDVTDRKTKEDTLTKEKNKATEENIAKSNYLASLSHEIRTPMGVIIGYSELLKDNMSIPDDCRKHLAAVDRNAKHLLELLNNVLDLSKIEANAFRLDLRKTNLYDQLIRTMEAFQFLAQRKNLKFSVDIAPILSHRMFLVDSLHIRQVVVNLLSNAIKFTSTGSINIQVTAHPVPDISGEMQRPAMSIEVSVTDTGMGISEADASVLFRPFVQAKNPESQKLGGTGLGLALSQRIARMMGGDVRLQRSVPNEGSCFVFSFVAEACDYEFLEAPKEEKIVVDGEPPLSNLSILIADDVVENQDLLKAFLADAGAKITLASNGYEALQKVRAEKYDVILMDIRMPVIDGLEATRLMRAEGVKTLIIAHSAHAFSHERGACLSAGCDDFIAKPLSPQLLVRKIKSMTRDSHALH